MKTIETIQVDRLKAIPHLSVEDISDNHMRITAPDGFRLNVRKVNRMLGPFWEFDPASAPSAISHFHLRYLIHGALNA